MMMGFSEYYSGRRIPDIFLLCCSSRKELLELQRPGIPAVLSWTSTSPPPAIRKIII